MKPDSSLPSPTLPPPQPSQPRFVFVDKRQARQRRRNLWIGVGILAAVIVPVSILAASSERDEPTRRVSSPVVAPAAPSCQPVVYTLGGTAQRVSITAANASGNTEQYERVLPFTANLGCVPMSQFVYIAAQNEGEVGSVTCSITRGGQEVAEASSSGAYVIATCSD